MLIKFIKKKNGNAKFNKGETVETQYARNLKYPSRGDHICVYCGGHAEYQLNDGRWCCKPSCNSCPAQRKTRANKRNSDGTPKRDYKKWWANLSPEKRKLQTLSCNTKEAHEKSTKTRLKRLSSGEIQAGFKGKHHSVETKKKQRLALNRRTYNGKMNQANFSEKACKFIDKLNELKGWNLQHAMNGGEICIEGYHLDGYDKVLNIAFEYDEKRHYKGPNFVELKLKDIIRMNEIHNAIGCRFFRFNEKLNLFYEVTDFGPIAQHQAEAMD